jgi:hypothetical protein
MDDTINTTPNQPKLLDKKQDELTMRDQLKLTAVIAGVMLAVPVVLGGVAAGLTALADRAERKAKQAAEKKENVIEVTATEVEN